MTAPMGGEWELPDLPTDGDEDYMADFEADEMRGEWPVFGGER